MNLRPEHPPVHCVPSEGQTKHWPSGMYSERDTSVTEMCTGSSAAEVNTELGLLTSEDGSLARRPGGGT